MPETKWSKKHFDSIIKHIDYEYEYEGVIIHGRHYPNKFNFKVDESKLAGYNRMIGKKNRLI